MMETQIPALARRSGSRYRNYICDSTILAACSLAVLLLPAVATVETGPPLTSFRAELLGEPAGRSNVPGFGNARYTNLVQATHHIGAKLYTGICNRGQLGSDWFRVFRP